MAERKLPKLETGVRFPSAARLPGPHPLLPRAREHDRRRRTELLQWTLLAPRPARLADLPSEADETDVHRHADRRRHELLHDLVCSLHGRPLRHPPEPLVRAISVRVSWGSRTR